MAEEGTVPRPRVPVQFGQGLDDSGPQGIEMEVPHEFEEVRLLLHHKGAVAILEQVALPMVAPVEGAGIAAEPAAHEGGQGPVARAQEEVDVVREQGPREDLDPRGLHLRGEAAEKIVPALGGSEEQRLLDPPGHHVVEDSGGIEPGPARHGCRVRRERREVK